MKYILLLKKNIKKQKGAFFGMLILDFYHYDGTLCSTCGRAEQQGI